MLPPSTPSTVDDILSANLALAPLPKQLLATIEEMKTDAVTLAEGKAKEEEQRKLDEDERRKAEAQRMEDFRKEIARPARDAGLNEEWMEGVMDTKKGMKEDQGKGITAKGTPLRLASVMFLVPRNPRAREQGEMGCL